MTGTEIRELSAGAEVIALRQGIRFPADYSEKDHYRQKIMDSEVFVKGRTVAV